MPRVILKSPYLKNGGAHIANYIKYIATREGVDKIDDSRKHLPATYNQKQLIEKILKDFPGASDMFEYEDFLKSPTRGNASEWVTRALEDHADSITGRKAYVNYIATRPRVEKLGSHGLFTDDDVPVELNTVAEEVGKHEGNIWTHIISLRREDAERLGFNNGKRWQSLLRAHAENIAKNMKIPFENFKWYAAYHDEGHHPHVHMVAYSSDPKAGYLTAKGIENIKSSLAKDIFSQDLISIYSEQTRHRNALTAESRSLVEDIIRQLNQGGYDNPKVEQLLLELSDRLKNIGGKKQYGYLKSDIKAIVDQIVDELAVDPRIAKLYDLWYKKWFDVLRTYRTEMPEKIPLSQQKEFKQIKNIIIAEAMNIGNGNFTLEDDILPEDDSEDHGDDAEPPAPEESPDMPDSLEYYAEWSKAYKEARAYLYGSGGTEQDFEKAYDLMLAEAEKGNAFALYDVGRMHMDGLGREADTDTAQQWYEKAYRAFIVAEGTWEKNEYIQYRIGKMHAQGYGVEQSYETAADWIQKAVKQGNPFAAYALGGFYSRGQGVEQNFKKAFDLYRQAAGDIKRPNVFAMYELGKMYRDGIGIDPDKAASDLWFKKAYSGFVVLEQQTKEDKLQYRLGQMNLRGSGTDMNFQAARDYFEKSAALENVNVMYRLGKLYLNRDFEGYDVKKAVKWLFEASKHENEFARYTLGKLFLRGEVVGKDVPYAISLLEQAAKQNNQWAQYTLGKTYLDGKDVPTDIQKAVAYLSASAEQGNQYAQYTLGKLYLKGEYVPMDRQKAVSLLTASADQDNEQAQYLLGKLYLKGELIPKNVPKGIELLDKAAGKGNQFAEFLLGKLYLNGGDVPKNIPAAVFYLERSADKGNQYALYALGKLYLYGSDVNRDEEKAIRYLTASASQGNPFAAALLQSIRQNRNHALFMGASRLLHHLGRMLKDKNDDRGGGKIGMADKKLRSKINEKKAAHGLRQE